METAAQTDTRELAERAVREERAFQKPDELSALADLLVERLPAAPRILEVGVGDGGTVWLWRQLWPAAEIVAVDVRLAPCEPCQLGRAHNGCPRRRISGAVSRLIVADSIRERGAVLGVLAWPFSDGFDFLHVDGDHSYTGCRSDVDTYAPLVRAGGVVAIHDTLGYPAVAQVADEIAPRDRTDPSRFRFETEPLTWGGYLAVIA